MTEVADFVLRELDSRVLARDLADDDDRLPDELRSLAGDLLAFCRHPGSFTSQRHVRDLQNDYSAAVGA